MSKKPDPDIEEAKLLYLADIISIREDNERLKKKVYELDMKNSELTREIRILRNREKERKERRANRQAERSRKEVREVQKMQMIQEVPEVRDIQEMQTVPEVPKVQEVQTMQDERKIRGIVIDGVIHPAPPKRIEK